MRRFGVYVSAEDPWARASRPPVLTFEEVGVRHGDRSVLRSVSASVSARGVTALVGPSGAGKTSLLRLCNRLDVPDTGRVLFRGHDIADLDPLLLRRSVGMVFQRPALFPGTVRDNLRVAHPDGDDAAYVEVLTEVALPGEMLDREAATLSGGEAQRVCLARTLVTRPEVLLLDEPTSALSAGPRQAFEDTARSLVLGGIPILWVTHDLAQLRRVADEVLVLRDGGLAYSGSLVGLEREAALVAMLAGSSS